MNPKNRNLWKQESVKRRQRSEKIHFSQTSGKVKESVGLLIEISDKPETNTEK